MNGDFEVLPVGSIKELTALRRFACEMIDMHDKGDISGHDPRFIDEIRTIKILYEQLLDY